jgi:hypothetical protein
MQISQSRHASTTNLETKLSNETTHNLRGKINFTSNSSRELCRTLDKYGIDINLEKIKSAHIPDTPTIFAHKDKQGNFHLNTGLYISDPKGGDNYGQFRFHEGRATEKYQVPECTKLVVNDQSLNELRVAYHEITGVTNFLRNVLDMKPGKDLEIFTHHPEYFSYLPPIDESSNGYLIFPNAPYIDPASLSKNPTQLKDSRDGICLGAYAIHPNQNLLLIETMGGPTHISDRNLNNDYTDNTRSLADIAAGTNVKYLASILDLDSTDVPMLEKLKEHVLSHLSEIYDVDNNKEKIQLYFHFPAADVTATLHLHVRVNVADHPLNQDRSFNLSDIIDTLNSGHSINDLILKRHDGILYTLVNENDSIRVIPEKSKVNNPNILNIA